MTEKRKISVRKILQVFLTLVLTTCCIIAMVSAGNLNDKKTIKNVIIYIKNSKKYHFIEQNEVMDKAINNRNINISATPISRLDIKSMESVLKSDPWIEDAQIYIDNDFVLNINVTQRLPIARFFTYDGNSCYMDSTLHTMPLSPNYNYYTTVVTNVPNFKNDSFAKSVKSQIRYLINFLQTDTFWSRQISQVIYDTAHTFELIPILGNQKIILGDTSCLKNKFANLYAFYNNILNKIGWDKYETLDLRFNNQIIGSPSLPYNGPIDKPSEDMNWINSIVEKAAEIEGIDTTNAEAIKKQDTVKQEIKANNPVNKPVAIKKNNKASNTKNSNNKKNKK